MRRHLQFAVPASFALVSILAGVGCGSEATSSTPLAMDPTCDDAGTGDPDSGNPDGGTGNPDGGGGCPNAPNCPPGSGVSGAEAAPVKFTAGGNTIIRLGGSDAAFPGNPGPNTGTIPGNVELGPLAPFLSFGAGGLLTSRSQASSPVDTSAASGALGENLSFEPGANPSQPLSIDLLALGGGGGLPAGLLDKIFLQFGAFAAETKFVNGVLQADKYRVGQADVVIRSPLVKDASAQLYQAIGGVDRQIEQIVNSNVNLGALQALIGGVLPLPSLTVESNMRDKIFASILAQPITSHNKLVTIDFSTGTVTIHLDQIVQGGLNNQPPNTELISSNDYPLIATTIHDLMHDVTNIALGTIEHSLDAVKLTLSWKGPVGPLGTDTLDVSWTFTLQQAVQGALPAPVNNSTGVVGTTLGTTLVTTINTLRTAGNAVGLLFKPAYDLIIANAGNGVFDLLINQLKFGFTSSVVNMLQPVFGMVAQVVSVQVNHQTTGTCTNGVGAAVPNSHSLSALSVGLLQRSDAARLDLGQAAGWVTIPGCN